MDRFKCVWHVCVSGLNVACSYARVTQVEVIAIQALVADTDDFVVARVAPNAFMYVLLRRWS